MKTDSSHSHYRRHLKHPKYRADIDGLRAVAVLSVVGFHAFPLHIKGGFIGVDIFFVISGYLISTIIFENLKHNRFSFIEFYSRRIKRIFPALLLVLVTCFAIGWIALLSDEFKQLSKHIAGGAGFISNFLFWNESGYFSNAADTKPLLHLWSLGIEEQFYIVWPLLIWFAWKQRWNLLIITTVIAFISFTLNIIKANGDPVATFYSPQTRFWELMAGSILAYNTLYPKGIHIKCKQIADNWLRYFWLKRGRAASIDNTFYSIQSSVGLILIAAGLLLITKEQAFPGWLGLLPCIGTALIISSGSNAWLNHKILSNRLLVSVGLISYPLYLWHWSLLSFTRILESQTPSSSIRVFIISISIVLAWLTYKLIERPFRFGAHNRAKTTFLLIAMVIIGFVGYGSYRMEGLESREVDYANLDNGWDGGAESYLTDECGINKNEDKALFKVCKQDVRETPKYALLGDSKAEALYRGLIRTSTDGGRWMVIAGQNQNGTPLPVLSENKLYGYYQTLTRIAITSITNNKDIETVVLVGAARALFQLKNDYSIQDLPTSKHYDAALEGLSNAVNIIIKAGKKIVIVVDNPTLPDPKDCMVRRTRSETINKYFSVTPNEHCRLKLADHLALSKQYRDLLFEIRSINPEMIKIFDTTEYLCNMQKGVCLSNKNGRALYSFTDHVSDYGAGIIGVRLNVFLNDD